MCKLKNIDDISFKQIVLDSNYLKEVALKCGYICTTNKRTMNKIKKRIQDMKLDTSHFKCQKIKNIEDVCIENGKYHRGGLKRRLIKEKILEEKCYICNINNIWNNKKLVLQLDHINGNNKDNRLENLRMLCPNCHSQTETFGGRNKYIKNIFKKKET